MKNAYDELSNNLDFLKFYNELIQCATYFVAISLNSTPDDKIKAMDNCIAEAFKAGMLSKNKEINNE